MESISPIKGVFARHPFSLTPRFSGVLMASTADETVFNGFVFAPLRTAELTSGKPLKTVPRIPIAPNTPLKRGVNESCRSCQTKIFTVDPFAVTAISKQKAKRTHSSLALPRVRFVAKMSKTKEPRHDQTRFPKNNRSR